jgi:hypothetical protein
MDVVRHSRLHDPTESALRALPYGTWPVPGEFYRDYIAAWLGLILEFTFAQQHCVNAWIIAQYGLLLSFSGAPQTTTSSKSELFHLIWPLRTSIKCCRNGTWPGCRTMRDLSRRSPTHSISFCLIITHLRRGDALSRIHIEWPMNARTYY